MDEMQRIRTEINRLVNKYNKLEKMPFDIGGGEMLYPSEMNMIEAIGKKTGNTVTELCIVFGVTKGAISQLITKLALKGYVQKVKNEAYSKEIELSLTDKGQEVFLKHGRFHKEMDQSMEQLLCNISSEKLTVFREILKLVDNHLDMYMNLSQKKI